MYVYIYIPLYTTHFHSDIILDSSLKAWNFEPQIQFTQGNFRSLAFLEDMWSRCLCQYVDINARRDNIVNTLWDAWEHLTLIDPTPVHHLNTYHVENRHPSGTILKFLRASLVEVKGSIPTSLYTLSNPSTTFEETWDSSSQGISSRLRQPDYEQYIQTIWNLR